MFKISLVVGIRPDFIRTSALIKRLEAREDVDLSIIWTGQHYDDNLMGVFFKELGISNPTHKLSTSGATHCIQHSKLILQLEETLNEIKPDVCIFLGDANAVVGSIVPLKLNIPIVHIEAGMRSGDWNMPEERNRTLIDSISNVLYVYHENYKQNLIEEGIAEHKIKVVGNTIVEIMIDFSKQSIAAGLAYLYNAKLEPYSYALMTLHRDGAMNNEDFVVETLNKVEDWCFENEIKCILPVMPRLRKIIDKRAREIWTESFIFIEPLGMFEFMGLEKFALIEFTDSGTNQEVSSLCGTPCVVLREATERPETFASNISVMETDKIGEAAESVVDNEMTLGFSLGPKNTSELIVNDLMDRLYNNKLSYEDNIKTLNRKKFSCKT